MKILLRPAIISLLSILSLFVITGCSLFGGTTAPTPFPENPEGEGDLFIGVPNPAAFYCQEMGYELEMRETNQGTVGMCVFPNGAECEQWEFLTGTCAVEWTFCQRQGYTIQAGEEIATCLFPDGSSCPEYDLFIGECLAPQ